MTQLLIQSGGELAPRTPKPFLWASLQHLTCMWPKQVGLPCGGGPWALGVSGAPAGDGVHSGHHLADSTLLSLQVNCIPAWPTARCSRGG